MAISGIENINIGLQNEAAGSDSLYVAFNKSKNNFTTLFSCASPTTNFVAGDGVAVEYSNSNTYLTITNTGVTNLVAGDDSIVLTQSNGNITITAPGGGNGGGGVSNIDVVGAAAGARITSTGGPIISSGIITLDLANSGVTAGTYTYPTVTVDQYGRVTGIANATSAGTVTSVGVTTTGVGIQISGSPITSSGNISIINTGVTRLNAGSGIALSSSNGNITVSMTTGAAGVTSVGISSTSLDVTNSPITSTGTMTVNLPTNTSIVGNLSVGNNLSITGNLTVSGNVVSNANVIGTLTANNLSVFGASSGNTNVSTVTGNLGLRTLASTYTDNVSAAGTIATAAIHAIGIPTLAASNAVTFTNAASFYIEGGPTAGTNATIGTGYALYVNSGNTYFGGANNYILGNLTVTGNTTYYNVDSFNVQDPIISLGGGANGAPLSINDGKDRGTALQYYTTAPVTAFMGWDTGNSEFAFGSNVTIASEVVTYNNLGNARGLTWLGNLVGTTANVSTIQNGNSNISITSNANITMYVAGNTTARLTATSSGVVANGTLGVSANVTSPQFISNIATGTAPLVVTSTTQVANLSVATAGSATTAGTVTTAAQPNITSVGSLTGLTLTANSDITMSGTGSQISGANLVNATYLTGTLTTAAQPNITTTGTLTAFTSNGNSVFNVAAANSVSMLASAAKTTDMVVLSTNGFPVTTAGVSALQITYVGGAAAVESSGARIDMTPGGTSGGIWNGWRFVGASGAATGVTMNALKVDSITTGTGGDNVLYVGTGWDSILNYNGTTIIDGTGQIPLIQNGNSNVSITANANVAIAVTGANRLVVTATGANIAGTGNVTGNLSVGGYTIFSAQATISAAGTAQANATALTKDINQVTVVAAGSGVILPTAVAGMRIFVRNAQATNALNVYPAVGGTINLLAANAAFSLALSTSATFTAVSATQWYT